MDNIFKKKFKNQSLEIVDIDELLEKEEVDADINPLLPNQSSRNSTRMLICGSSGSGKTSMLINLLRHLRCDGLYICAKNIDQPKFRYIISFFEDLEKKLSKKLKKDISIIKCLSNNLDDFVSVNDINSGKYNIVIFDDMMNERDTDGKISDFFVMSRHKKVSCFYLSQSFFQTPRQVRLNCNTYVLFGMPSISEARRIHGEIASDITKEQFLDFMRQVAATPYAFLYVDKNATNKLLRYRKNLDEILDY